MANVTRNRSFFIGLALTDLRPRIESITKQAIWQANSTLAVLISVANARSSVLIDTGLPVCKASIGAHPQRSQTVEDWHLLALDRLPRIETQTWEAIEQEGNGHLRLGAG